MKIRDISPLGKGDLSFLEYKNLLMNAVKISGLNFNEEKFVKNALIEGGQVGYDKLIKKWAYVAGHGRNELGDPESLTFIYPNGKSYQRPATYDPSDDGAYIIKAFPDTYAMAEVIKKTTDIINDCNRAIKQNLTACQTPMIVSVRDEDTRYSIEHAIQQKVEGVPIIKVDGTIGEALQGLELRTDYLVDKFVIYRDSERDKLLNKLGIMSANINKKERVQVGEVNATTGQCSDCIYAWIDTFNKQMESYGLEFRMSFNGALEELYEGGSDESEDNEVLNNGNNQL